MVLLDVCCIVEHHAGGSWDRYRNLDDNAAAVSRINSRRKTFAVPVLWFVRVRLRCVRMLTVASAHLSSIFCWILSS